MIKRGLKAWLPRMKMFKSFSGEQISQAENVEDGNSSASDPQESTRKQSKGQKR